MNQFETGEATQTPHVGQHADRRGDTASRRVVPPLIAHGIFPHPWLGVTGVPLTPKRVRAYNEKGAQIPVGVGLLVLSVEAGSTAERAGLRGGRQAIEIKSGVRMPVDGDVILALDAEPIEDEEDVLRYLDTNKAVGDELAIRYLRDGVEYVTMVRLEARP